MATLLFPEDKIDNDAFWGAVLLLFTQPNDIDQVRGYTSLNGTKLVFGRDFVVGGTQFDPENRFYGRSENHPSITAELLNRCLQLATFQDCFPELARLGTPILGDAADHPLGETELELGQCQAAYKQWFDDQQNDPPGIARLVNPYELLVTHLKAALQVLKRITDDAVSGVIFQRYLQLHANLEEITLSGSTAQSVRCLNLTKIDLAVPTLRAGNIGMRLYFQDIKFRYVHDLIVGWVFDVRVKNDTCNLQSMIRILEIPDDFNDEHFIMNLDGLDWNKTKTNSIQITLTTTTDWRKLLAERITCKYPVDFIKKV